MDKVASLFVLRKHRLYGADSCDGDQVWTDCGSETTRTCADPNPDTSQEACVPRCQCPDDRPVWDDSRKMCISADECVERWRLVNLVRDALVGSVAQQ